MTNNKRQEYEIKLLSDKIISLAEDNDNLKIDNRTLIKKIIELKNLKKDKKW